MPVISLADDRILYQADGKNACLWKKPHLGHAISPNSYTGPATEIYKAWSNGINDHKLSVNLSGNGEKFGFLHLTSFAFASVLIKGRDWCSHANSRRKNEVFPLLPLFKTRFSPEQFWDLPEGSFALASGMAPSWISSSMQENKNNEVFPLLPLFNSRFSPK